MTTDKQLSSAIVQTVTTIGVANERVFAFELPSARAAAREVSDSVTKLKKK